MKMMQIQYIALFLVGSFSLAAASNGMRGAAASSQLQHPPPAFPIKAAAGPAAAKKTALPTLDSTTVTWKVKNLNYYDLTKEWKDPFAGGAKKMTDAEMNDAQTKRKKAKSSGKQAPLGPAGLGEGVKHIDKGLGAIGDGFKDLGKDINKDIDEGVKNTDKGIADAAKGKAGKDINKDIDAGLKHTDKSIADAANVKNGASKDGADGLLDGVLPETLADGKMPWPTQLFGEGDTVVDAVQSWRQRHHQMSMLRTKRGRHSLAQQVAQQLSALGPMTVQKALRRTLEGAVKDVLACDPSQGPMPAPAPAPAPGPAKSIIPDGIRPSVLKLSVSRFRAMAPSPASAPSPAPGPSPMSACPQPKVHVALLPGGKMKNKHRNSLLNSEKRVTLTLRLGNIDYDKVNKAVHKEIGRPISTLKAAVEKAVQKAVLEVLPGPFHTSHVSVTLSSGSAVALLQLTTATPVATITITPTGDWTAEKLMAGFREGRFSEMEKFVRLWVIAIYGPLRGALVAGKTLKDITVTAGRLSLVEKRSGGRLLNAPVPQAISVAVTVYDRPGNGMNDLHFAATELKKALLSGELMERIRSAIYAVTGVVPKVSGLRVKAKVIKQWDIVKCENHMTQLVKSFTVHYTRDQVPMALYNECTNFMTKISFSHDYVLDKRDAARCRAATRKFSMKWKGGKNNNPEDFAGMCGNFCEAKYGNDAPQCRMADPAHASKLTPPAWKEVTPPAA